ncbi:MAG: hypothetical protein ACRDQB_06945 [Thermocrispum sp.]
MRQLWQLALTDGGTFVRRALLVQAMLHLTFGFAGLIANPDFATGDEATAVQVLGVDFNGWHALGGFLLWGPALIAWRRTDWTLWYSLAVIVTGLVPAVWMLYDTSPLGLLVFPNTETDLIYHVIGAAVLAATTAIHVARVRRHDEAALASG